MPSTKLPQEVAPTEKWPDMPPLNIPKPYMPGGEPPRPEKPGFFIYEKKIFNEDQVRHYITDWECCRCNRITRITDQNSKWKARNSPPDPLLRSSMAFETGEPCPNDKCHHSRCETCWNLDATAYRRRYCGGAHCEGKFAKQRLQMRELRSDGLSGSSGAAGVREGS